MFPALLRLARVGRPATGTCRTTIAQAAAGPFASRAGGHRCEQWGFTAAPTAPLIGFSVHATTTITMPGAMVFPEWSPARLRGTGGHPMGAACIHLTTSGSRPARDRAAIPPDRPLSAEGAWPRTWCATSAWARARAGHSWAAAAVDQGPWTPQETAGQVSCLAEVRLGVEPAGPEGVRPP